MRIAIIGTGYVGLVTGTGFANLGNDVLCVDIAEDKIRQLRNGQIPIYEPGLYDIFKRNVEKKRLKFTSDMREAVRNCDIIFICVGTPSAIGLDADLSAVDAVAADIGAFMDDYKVVVNKSTVPVGTADRVRRKIRDSQPSPTEFDVVSNPEFLREGAAIKDFENPDRIVVGTDSQRAEDMMATLYRSVARTGRPIMFTNVRSAELIKYASNAMLATRISFMNQLSYLCEKTGADIKEVAKGLGLDNRIGPRFLQAGLGYGGSCFPKDVRALIATLKQFGCESDLFEAVNRINENQKTIVVDKLSSAIDVQDALIALWGLSFKPKTDDIREAPSLDIIAKLDQLGARIQAYDPVAVPNAEKVLKNVRFFNDPYETIRDCDALIVVTEWDEFRNLDMRAVKVLLKQPVVVDGRNIYDAGEMKEMGFKYFSVGRG